MKILCLAAALAAATIAPVQAQDFPTRPVTHVFPWAPSGPAYAASQTVTERMSEILGETVGMQAKTGAGGVNAFLQAMAEPADGYTTIDGWVAPLVLAPLSGRVEYDYEDFTPLHPLLSSPFAIMVRADDERFPDFAAMQAFLEDNRGGLRYSAGDDLALPHQVTALVFRGQDMVARHIPYTGMPDAVKDLRGGILDFTVANAGQYRANVGELRVLAVLSDDPEASERLFDGAPIITDLLDTLDIGGLSMVGWTWWLVLKDTPEDRVAVLRDAMLTAKTDPAVVARINELGFSMLSYEPDAYAETVATARDDLAAATDAIDWEKSELAAR